MLLADDYLIFISASTLMALGIGIDAALATFVRASYLKEPWQAAYWIGGVVATHTLFPMVGYLLAYLSVQYVPIVAPLVGVTAFLLVAHFLYGELIQSSEPQASGASWISIGLILAVSWDALWSGPAKSAQVLDWSTWMIWLSFLWVGVLVLLLCVVSFYCGKRWMHLLKGNAVIMPYVLWLQFSVIGYFGLLALFRYTFNWSLDEVGVFILSGSIIALAQWRQKQAHATTWQFKPKV